MLTKCVTNVCDRFLAIRWAKIILKSLWDCLSAKLATKIFPIAGDMSVFMHAYACPYPLWIQCVRVKNTHYWSWVDAREREGGEGKKEGEEGRGNGGGGRKETASARKYKEPDRARNFSPFHIFHAENTTPSNKVRLSILFFANWVLNES